MYLRAQAARRGRRGEQMQEWEEELEQLEVEMSQVRGKRELEASTMAESLEGSANVVQMRSLEVISIMTLVFLPMSFMATFFSIEI